MEWGKVQFPNCKNYCPVKNYHLKKTNHQKYLKKGMVKQKINFNSEVTDFLDEQNHPLRKEIEQLRICILKSSRYLTENIKWNGPNYCFNKEDRITMRIKPPEQIQLIFHRGAKVMKQPEEKLITEDFGMLVWKGNDRAIATFKNMQEIQNGETNITKIIKEWINAAK